MTKLDLICPEGHNFQMSKYTTEDLLFFQNELLQKQLDPNYITKMEIAEKHVVTKIQDLYNQIREGLLYIDDEIVSNYISDTLHVHDNEHDIFFKDLSYNYIYNKLEKMLERYLPAKHPFKLYNILRYGFYLKNYDILITYQEFFKKPSRKIIVKCKKCNEIKQFHIPGTFTFNLKYYISTGRLNLILDIFNGVKPCNCNNFSKNKLNSKLNKIKVLNSQIFDDPLVKWYDDNKTTMIEILILIGLLSLGFILAIF